MKLVKLDEVIDPTADLERLPSLEGEPPSGAWGFASDPGHYDFYGTQCVKDLNIAQVVFSDDGASSLTIRFERNEWKHESGLTVRYRDVAALLIDVDETSSLGPKRLGSVILDEVLPHERGCRHEIAFTGGSIVGVCADLDAAWQPMEVVDPPG
jgi:hypothetical protein